MGMTILAILFYGMWEIWKQRCRMKFEGDRLDVNNILRRVYNHVYDCTRANQPKRDPTTLDKICLEDLRCEVRVARKKIGRWLCWNRPDVNELKLNVDGAYKNGTGGGGGLLRDHSGDFICGFTAPYNIDDAMEAEILAIYDGMEMCLEQGKTNILIESDAATVVKMISGNALELCVLVA